MIIESLSQPISLSRRTYHDVWRLLIIMVCVSCIGVGLAWLTTFYTPILAVAMIAGVLVMEATKEVYGVPLGARPQWVVQSLKG